MITSNRISGKHDNNLMMIMFPPQHSLLPYPSKGSTYPARV